MPKLQFSSQNKTLPWREKWRRWWQGELAQRPLAEQLPYLQAWFRGPCGQEVLQVEQEILDRELSACFGYHLLNMSVAPCETLTEASPIHHQVCVSPQCASQAKYDNDSNDDISAGKQAGLMHRAFCCAELSALPIESESVDVVLLQHTLEFSPNPHQVLKEVNRVLVHRGHVIIVAFNTFSLFGVCKRIGALFSRSRHWQHSSLSLFRLNDWFKLLDLEAIRVEQAFYRPPLDSAALLKRSAFLDRIGHFLHLPVGGVQVIVARKDVCGVTPIKTSWQKNTARRLVKIPGIQPAPRQGGHMQQPSEAALKKRILH